MKMGVLRPERLISLRAVEKRYSEIQVTGDELRIGALSTLSALERSPVVRNLMVRRLRSGIDPSALPCPDTTVEADSSACPRAAVHARPVDRLRSPAPRSPS